MKKRTIFAIVMILIIITSIALRAFGILSKNFFIMIFIGSILIFAYEGYYTKLNSK